MVSTVIINLVLTLGLAVLFGSFGKRLPTRSQFLLLLSTYLLWPAVLYSINLESGLSEHISTLLPVFCASLLVFVQVCPQFQTHVYPLKHQYKWSLIAVFVALLYLGVENIYLGWLDPPKQHLLAISENTTLSIQLAIICFVVVLAPMIEEILFRGLLFHALEVKLSPSSTIALSGLLFGLVHIEVPALIPLLVVLGWILGWLRFKSNSMVPPLILHMVNNGLAILLSMMNSGSAST
ncbi:MAG: CPBP family intramembrane glutamic endopeptidase [Myxococcota bacterium]